MYDVQVYMAAVFLIIIIALIEYSALDFKEGQCVYHVLDTDTKGIVINPKQLRFSDVAARFAADEGWQYYDPEELRKCEDNDE